MQIDRLSEIIAFVRTVEVGSLSSAARGLSSSPSTISKLISRLEDRLGARLLNRNARSLSLTQEGRIFYERSLKIIEALDEAEQSLSSDRADLRGLLRVHCLPAFATKQLAPIMPEFSARYPQLKVEFVLGVEHYSVVEGNIDVAIHIGYLTDSSLVTRKLATSRWLICGSPAYLEKHGIPKTPADLANHNCLTHPVDSSWNPWLVTVNGKTERAAVDGTFVSNQASMLLELAEAGVGLIRLAEYFLADAVKRGSVVPVLEKYCEFQDQSVIALYQNRKHLSPRIKVFLDFLEVKFRNPPWQTHR